jgi:hypothetical protein
MFGSALRYLDSGAATVLVIGTCGVSGHAVIGADRLAGRLGRPELPAQVIKDARSMLGSGRAVHSAYCVGGETGSARVQVWMQSHPEGDTHVPRIQPELASRPGLSRPASHRA